MKTRYLFLTAAILGSMPLAAQETYENAKLTGEDLNGTARYVGMGGAMDALGADLSTISSNPAGIGLFRHSTINVSGGLLFQNSVPSYAHGDKTHASFDQAGFVWTQHMRRGSFLNFAFNYSKDRNFNYLLSTRGSLNGHSSGELTNHKLNDYTDKDGNISKDFNYVYNQVDELNYGAGLDTINYTGQDYTMNRQYEGYTGNYDFNISGNIHDRVFLGVTFGVKDVNEKYHGDYIENTSYGQLDYYDYRSVDGTGFDITVGAIIRPFENSPFRFGAYVKTPTWYDLTVKYEPKVSWDGGYQELNPRRQSFDYKIYTPWKFGLSIGHTVGNFLALGLSYDYADYGTTKNRVVDGYEYDYWYGDAYESSYKDVDMNEHTKDVLRGVSTLKLGLEYKPIQQLAIRLGYNYVSPKYEENGQKGFYNNGNYVQSDENVAVSNTDYTNWKATNRFTCGLGFTAQKWNIDLAYQYSAQKGDFHPFAGYRDVKSEVKNDRSQLLLTLGYHF